jgi:hypothetical protein
MTVGSRSSPGWAAGSNRGTEERDELWGGFFLGDDRVPVDAEALVDLRARFFRGCTEGCETSTSEEGPVSPD